MFHIIILHLEKYDTTLNLSNHHFLHYLLLQLLEKQEMLFTESPSVQESVQSQLNDDELKGIHRQLLTFRTACTETKTCSNFDYYSHINQTMIS